MRFFNNFHRMFVIDFNKKGINQYEYNGIHDIVETAWVLSDSIWRNPVFYYPSAIEWGI